MKDDSYEVTHTSSFISANSERGFFSLYDEVFAPERFDRIFIIAGGPGTGKSSLLRQILTQAKEKDISTEAIFCSSDPTSLDGVILAAKDRRIGILDGTPPHGRIPTLPGVTEELINLGDFWNSSQITKAKGAILALGERKKNAYARAYALLRALGAVREEERLALLPHLDKEKMTRQIRHKLGPLRKHGAGERRFLRAMSSLGDDRISFTETNVQNLLLISGKEGSAEIYLRHFAESLRDLRLSHRVFLSPISPDHPDAIYLEENKTLLIKEELMQGALRGRRIIADRFFREIPEEGKERRHLELTLKSAVLNALKAASNAHGEIERYYGEAMDFPSLSRFAQEATQRVMKELCADT